MVIIGVSIFIFGLIFLLRNLGLLHFPASFWSVFYPLAIMAVGFVILAVTHKGKKIIRFIKEVISGNKDEEK